MRMISLLIAFKNRTRVCARGDFNFSNGDALHAELARCQQRVMRFEEAAARTPKKTALQRCRKLRLLIRESRWDVDSLRIAAQCAR
jgi:hypothetical protein